MQGRVWFAILFVSFHSNDYDSWAAVDSFETRGKIIITHKCEYHLWSIWKLRNILSRNILVRISNFEFFAYPPESIIKYFQVNQRRVGLWINICIIWDSTSLLTDLHYCAIGARRQTIEGSELLNIAHTNRRSWLNSRIEAWKCKMIRIVLLECEREASSELGRPPESASNSNINICIYLG